MTDKDVSTSLPHLRLDADRAREDLENTLDEIEKLMRPRALLRAAAGTIRRHTGAFLGVSGGVVAIVSMVIVLRIRAERHG